MGCTSSTQQTTGVVAAGTNGGGGGGAVADGTIDSVVSVEDALQESFRPTSLSTRQNFVWVRENVDMTDVYDVIETIGSGSMGEVSIVKKKQEASERLAERASSFTEKDVEAAIMTGTVDTTTTPSKVKTTSTTSTPGTIRRRRYACKTINTVRFTDAEILEFINEINILRDLDHPNVIQLFEVFKRKRKMWIVMELCTGGDLTKRISAMSEVDVAIVMKQIVRAIAYMHNRNVCHRDIKLENLLYADSSKDAEVKLIDFGLSNKFAKGEKMQKACGTIYSVSPEVILGQPYSEETDIWSLGCIAFILLSGEYPFLKEMRDLEDNAKMDALRNARLTFGYTWQLRGISNCAREFVKGCCRKDPNRRWNAKQALEFIKSKWIPHLEDKKKERQASSGAMPETIQEGKQESSQSTSQQELGGASSKRKRERERTRMDTGMVKGMGNFVLYGELKKTILMTMAHTMDKSSLHELREIFTSLDSDGTGTVSLVDLKGALKRMHSDKNLDDETLEKLFHGIDVDESGQIHYIEFLAAVVESQGLITMEHLADAFDRLDGDEKGYISKDDLKNLLGTDYNEEKVNKMINEADYKKNGQIDYDEFLRLMFEDPESGLDVLGKTIVSAQDATMIERLAPIELSRDIKGHDVSTHASSPFP